MDKKLHCGCLKAKEEGAHNEIGRVFLLDIYAANDKRYIEL